MKAILRSLLDATFSLQPGMRDKLTHYLLGEKLKSALRKLQSQGLKMDVVYDIGARHGDWSKAMQKVLPEATFILFEANRASAKVLDTTGFPYVISVLSSESKTVDFYETGSTGDSYYKENTPRYDNVTPTARQTDTLDALVAERSLAHAKLIKLDTQGSELDILRGGEATLGHAHLTYLECPILNYNRGAPALSDYLEYLGSHGFIPYEICELHYAYGALVQMDVLFIRKTTLRDLVTQELGGQGSGAVNPSPKLPQFLE